MIEADLSEESAVLEAFTKTAADPELPPIGVIIFVGQRSFDGTDSDGALARARDLIWAIAATHARRSSAAGTGSPRGCGW